MRIIYGIFAVKAWLISRFPFWLLYLLSDVLYLVIFHLAGYRKKVTRTNIERAFPNMSDQERKRLARQYYHRLADLILEVIKIQGMSKSTFDRRMRQVNPEVITDILARNQSVILATGHLGNWEWYGVYMSYKPDILAYAMVKPLNNDYFERYVRNLRLKFSEEGLIDFRKGFREMVRYKDQVRLTLIAGDQTPTKDEINYWTTFLNQDTAVFLGIEKIARTLNQAVVFMNIYPARRGFYNIEYTLLTDKPKETADYEITEAHVRMLEQVIRERPSNWLWSHRRWKHKKEDYPGTAS